MKIALSIVLAMFLVSCSEDKTTTHSVELKTPKQEVKKVSEQVTPSESKLQTTESTTVAVKQAPKIVASTPKTIEPKIQAQEPTKVEVKKIALDGAQIFTKCTSCHGKDAAKKALNRSQVIKGWNAQKVQDALNGYKKGTYGGAMKGVMQAQVSKLSDAEIEAVAKYIAGL